METIYEEIPHVRAQLREEADQLASHLGPWDKGSQAEAEHDEKVRFGEIDTTIASRPVHLRRSGRIQAGNAHAGFRSLRRCAARRASHADALDDLENICEEEQQLSRQTRIYRWLHAWLLVHVPLSIALLVLGGGPRRHGAEILIMERWRMAGRTRTTKKLAQRIDLDYFKRAVSDSALAADLSSRLSASGRGVAGLGRPGG